MQFLKYFLFVVLSILIASEYSCKKDKCADVQCQNGGTCNDGSCNCPVGYSGTSCETYQYDCTNNPSICIYGNCNNGVCNCDPGYFGPKCDIDSCDATTCLNGGTCVGASCNCASGYEGRLCDVKTTSRFVGNYVTLENCAVSPFPQYNTTITAHNSIDNQIIINKLKNLIINATVSGTTLSIVSHSPTGTYDVVTGSGAFNNQGNQIIVNVTLQEAGTSNTVSCVFTMIRQ
jgi:hypothetical protein